MAEMTKKNLDEKDVDIISALNEHGVTTPVKDLSIILDIPIRTIRHRLARLIDNKLVNTHYPMVHERKLGLGEAIVSLQPYPQVAICELMKRLDCFYMCSATFGTINGFQVGGLYPTTHPNLLEDLLKNLVDRGLIKQYYLLHITDYNLTNVNLDKFNLKTMKWNWDWQNWIRDTQNIKIGEEEIKRKIYPSTSRIEEFDKKDIAILRYLKSVTIERTSRYGLQSYTLRQIAQEVELSEPYIRKRIERMEKLGIIKEYYLPINIISEENRILIYFYFESNKPLTEVIQALELLPYSKTVVWEDEGKFVLIIYFNAIELEYFLAGISNLRSYLTYFGIQIVPNFVVSEHHEFRHYNEKTHSWDIPFHEYKKIIREFKP